MYTQSHTFYNTHFQNLKINLITLTYHQIKFSDAKFHLSTAKKLLTSIIDNEIIDIYY